jgi:adenine-specific DNA-methyltransferase
VIQGPQLRYMGTKRELVPYVKACVDKHAGSRSRFVDLFAGTGAVAGSLVHGPHVTCSDALGFPAVLARARFLRRSEALSINDERRLAALAAAHAQPLLEANSQAMGSESQCLTTGHAATRNLIAEATHVGNSPSLQAAARDAAERGDHVLALLYFARGYFSTAQAIALDAHRRAIDQLYPDADEPRCSWVTASARDVLLAAWLLTASRIMNSPGHCAQFLRSNSEVSHARVAAAWRRSVTAEFGRIGRELRPLGDSEWRRSNRVMQCDATAIPEQISRRWCNSVLYADPPYTKDHYSRYYHVLETLLRYDYPTSRGAGRVRDDRHLSAFCYRSRAAQGFQDLAATAAAVGAPLIVSYPAAGLLSADELRAALEPYGQVTVAAEIGHAHSTLGGSPGRAKTAVVERLYVLRPH